ncbi:hypothetical protein NITHO_5520006 [Nitrolancea hollandica Lb]|uniref:Uncharacterized protein n=1 Tax=Nitrolancea hollandica Lb TaxID=1129897 RepID=I4EM18_9BACT|nr:hypothetical protein NITHO_5520006 [Nitrolancea hollandica Lb]
MGGMIVIDHEPYYREFKGPVSEKNDWSVPGVATTPDAEIRYFRIHGSAAAGLTR